MYIIFIKLERPVTNVNINFSFFTNVLQVDIGFFGSRNTYFFFWNDALYITKIRADITFVKS